MKFPTLRSMLCCLLLGFSFMAFPAHAEDDERFTVEKVTATGFEMTNGFVRHYISRPADGDPSCTTAQLLQAAEAEGAGQELVQRTMLDAFNRMHGYVKSLEGQTAFLNIYACRAVSPPVGYIALVCLDGEPGNATTTYFYCAQLLVDSYVENPQENGMVDDLPQDNLDSMEVGQFEPAEPLVGTTVYAIKDDTIRLTLVHADDTTHRFRLGHGVTQAEREPACRTEKLFEILDDTAAEVGDNYPRNTYDQLLEVIASDTNGRGFVWYGECDRIGVATSGLLCVAPWQDTPVEVRLEACAYTEGVVIDN